MQADISSCVHENMLAAFLQLSDTESPGEFKVRDMELEKGRVREQEIEETEAVDCYTLVTTGGVELKVAEVGAAFVLPLSYSQYLSLYNEKIYGDD